MVTAGRWRACWVIPYLCMCVYLQRGVGQMEYQSSPIPFYPLPSPPPRPD